jgi:hypothetical protein
MKTVKKKVTKKVVTPNGAITNSKKPLLAKKAKPKQSDLRVNAGSNTELFTYLENVKQDFLRGYKYPTQLSMKEQIVQGGKEFNKPNYPFTDMGSPMREFPKADPELKAFADNPSFPFLHGGTGGPMIGTYPKVEAPKEVTIKSLLSELADRVQNLNAEIYNHKDAIYPIIGDITFADFEDIKQSPVPAITQLTQIISEVNAAKERLFQLTVAVQNTLG